MSKVNAAKLRFLIVSGPTQEPIDPVRFLSNYSTGVMGKKLVSAAKERGHRVEWVECPTRARTAIELDWLLARLMPENDVLIMAAAVADVRPLHMSGSKIKKDKLKVIRLVKNPDILQNLSKKKKRRQIFIGFGLESENLSRNGAKKIQKKKLELIVLQRVTENKKPFGNKPIDAILMDANGDQEPFRTVTKQKLAGILVRKAESLFALKNRD